MELDNKKREVVVDDRPSWDEIWMEIAQVISKRSTCLRRKVGAVIVSEDNWLLSAGYNGAPKGIEHCDVKGCKRQELQVPSGQRAEICNAVHAEQNAIILAARNGLSIIEKRPKIYVTASPCIICAKMIINAGIREVIYGDEYPDKMAMDLLEESDVEVRCLVKKK